MRSYSFARVLSEFLKLLLIGALFASTFALADSSTPTDTIPDSGSASNPSATLPPSTPPKGAEPQKQFSRIPQHQLVRPNWAIGINVSLNAFGGTAIVAGQGSTPSYGFSIMGEYQPSFLQSIGVLGIGPSFNLYPMSAGGITPGLFSLLSAGGMIRYQARFFRQQPLVPIVAYHVEYFKYQFSTGVNGAMVMSGPSVGLWFFLNIIEPSSAAQMYISTKIARSYLTFEWRNMSGQDSNLAVSGGSYYFGLRFEF